MRRVSFRNPSKTIGITLATVFMAGALFCAGMIFAPSSEGKEPRKEDTLIAGNVVQEDVSVENDSEQGTSEQSTSEAAPKEQTMKIEITTPDESTLNHQENKSKISASRQSSLERAVDDLIVLTESDG